MLASRTVFTEDSAALLKDLIIDLAVDEQYSIQGLGIWLFVEILTVWYASIEHSENFVVFKIACAWVVAVKQQ